MSSAASSAPATGAAGSASASPATAAKPSLSCRIRPASAGDVDAMHDMIHELALYEKAPECVLATAEDLRVALFGPEPKLFAHVAEVRDTPAAASSADASNESGSWRVQGMAIWYVTYSTWRGKHGLWLEDLYVRPAFRGSGIGRGLLRTLASVAVEKGWARYEWNCLDWNTDAQKVYAGIGAEPLSEWTIWRLTGDKLVSFARGDDQAQETPIPARAS